MKANLKMTQSLKAKTAESSVLPANFPLNLHQSLPPAEADTSLKRGSAWQIAPNLLVSFKYAWAGVSYAFVTQRNFRIHAFIGVVAVSLGSFLKVAAVGMGLITLTCALVLVLELLNTALESVVDLTVGQSYHELAKIAKDCAAGAVLIAALAALLVASYILLPPLLALVI
jgi:diacylglycerol kinase (ATP)